MHKHPHQPGRYLFLFKGEEQVLWYNKVEFYAENFEDIEPSLLINAEEYTIKYTRSILLNKFDHNV